MVRVGRSDDGEGNGQPLVVSDFGGCDVVSTSLEKHFEVAGEIHALFAKRAESRDRSIVDLPSGERGGDSICRLSEHTQRSGESNDVEN